MSHPFKYREIKHLVNDKWSKNSNVEYTCEEHNGKFRKAVFWLTCCSQVSGIKDRHEMAYRYRLM